MCGLWIASAVTLGVWEFYRFFTLSWGRVYIFIPSTAINFPLCLNKKSEPIVFCQIIKKYIKKMSNKILLVALVLMVGLIGAMSWKVKSAVLGTTSESEVISLSTDPSPLKLGQATFIIDVNDKNGKSVDNATVSFDLNMTTMNMGTQQGEATSQGNGRYSAVGNMSMQGSWRIRFEVAMPDGSIQNKDFVVNVL